MTTTCVIQARTGSKRLPGKVLQPLGGRPMLRFMLDRLQSLAVDRVVVATSDLERDDAIADIAGGAGVAVVRGDETDVLDRFVSAAREHPADHFVRLTADCPLIDPALVAQVLATHLLRGADYTSNVFPRTFPKGLDVEIVTAQALHRAARDARAQDEREHVTPYVYRRPDQFRLTNHSGSRPLGHERWTVDTLEDLEFVRRIVAAVDDIHAPWTEFLRVAGIRSRPGRGELHLRPATAADAARILAWRNERDAIRWSTTASAVEPDRHAVWFARMLEDAGRRVWIGEVDATPIGMVRIDVDDGVATVSVAVDAQRRGHGAGTGLLRALDRELVGDCQVVSLRALVHPANAASAHIFERAGYVAAGTDPACGFVEFRRGSGVPQHSEVEQSAGSGR